MTKPLVRQSFIQVQDPKRDKQNKQKLQLFFLMPLCSSGSPPNFASK